MIKKNTDKKLTPLEKANEEFFKKYNIKDENYKKKFRKFSKEFAIKEEERLQKIEEKELDKINKKANTPGATITLFLGVICLFIGYMIIDGNFAFFHLLLKIFE